MVAASDDPFAHLHIVTHLEWEREGQHTYEFQRARLLDELSQVLHDLQSDTQPLRHIMLSNQTIIFDDIGAVRPDVLATLAVYNAAERLSVGPWYVQLDETASNGETLIRSLLFGREDAVRHGIQLHDVAFLPTICQHPAQLPQILQGFGISAALLCSGNLAAPLPFRWEAPDESSVLVVTYPQFDSIQQAVDDQKDGQPDGPFLWLQPAQNWHDHVDATTARYQTALSEYMRALRQRFPDVLRPRLQRDLWFPTRHNRYGRFSSRPDMTQQNARLQALLNYTVEPMLSLALVYGAGKYMENSRALLNHAWRSLLQNQTPTIASGAMGDTTYAAATQRFARIAEGSQYVLDKALAALPGKRQQSTPTTMQTFIVVWNPHGHEVKQVVDVQLAIRDALYPETLTDPDDDSLTFSWDIEAKKLTFKAVVPPLGYAVYRLELSEDDLSDLYRKRIVAGRAIGNTQGEVLRINNGQLEWTTKQTAISNLITYVDGGDAGDVWHYQEPQPDVVMTGSIVDVVQVEATPVYDRLIFRSRMRIAPRLQDGQSRSRGLKVLDITTEATYYNDIPGLHLRTIFENTAEDHRLRVNLRTGFNASAIITDSTYSLTRQTVAEAAQNPRPLQSLALLQGEKQHLALLTRGLPEIELNAEDDQTMLSLTLLRAVGWLDKAAQIAAPSAQMQQTMTCEYLLIPYGETITPTQLLQTSQAYQTALQAFQYETPPPQARHSYLQIEPVDKVVVTAVKPPQEGEGMVLRLLNPTGAPVVVNLKSHAAIASATQRNLDESHQADLTIEGEHVAKLVLRPNQIGTIQLEFD